MTTNIENPKEAKKKDLTTPTPRNNKVTVCKIKK
jgi:hypothetical protein